MKASDLLKDKNKLLMGIPIILGMLFIYVFFIHAGQSEETQQKEDASAFFEPTAQESEKAGDKLEAYKRDELEKQEEERIRKESDVKGSDFYFDLHNREEEYDERKLERIRRMQGDPYSEVMSGYGGGRQGRFAQQLDQQLDGLEDEEALNEIIREARKNARSARTWTNRSVTARRCISASSNTMMTRKRRKPRNRPAPCWTAWRKASPSMWRRTENGCGSSRPPCR